MHLVKNEEKFSGNANWVGEWDHNKQIKDRKVWLKRENKYVNKIKRMSEILVQNEKSAKSLGQIKMKSDGK